MSTAPEADAGILAGDDLAGRVVRGGLLRAVAYTVVNLLGVAGSVVLLRHLGVAEFGRYGTVIALVAIATGLADAGLNITGSRESHSCLQASSAGASWARCSALGCPPASRGAGAVGFAVIAGYSSEWSPVRRWSASAQMLVGVQSTLTLPLVVQLRTGC